MEEKVTKGGRTRRTTASKAPAAAAAKTPAAAATKPAATRKAAAPRKTATPAAARPSRTDEPERGELVRLAAYFRAERRGFAPGYELEDWLAAEAEVSARLGSVPPARPRAPSRKPRGA